MKKQLEVGDALIGHSRMGYSKVVIEKVTPKRAYGNGITFIREYSESNKVEAMGGDVWNSISFEIANIGLLKNLHKQNINRYLNKANFDHLSFEELETVYKIVKNAHERNTGENHEY